MLKQLLSTLEYMIEEFRPCLAESKERRAEISLDKYSTHVIDKMKK